jgi:uncharacterized membrane protein YfcA
MSLDTILLLVAGAGAGLVGSVAGLASLVSYPTLLAAGLSPVAANVTNTVAMTGTTIGAAASSVPELRGQGRRLLTLGVQMSVGGLLGVVLLLGTPASAFESVVPWLIALGAALLLVRDRLRSWALHPHAVRSAGGVRRLAWLSVLILVGAYAGYFGAGAGIILLATLAIRHDEPLAVTNAVKNVGTGVANVVASVVYIALGPVDLVVAVTLGAGAVVGAWVGPKLFRVLPEAALRRSVAVAGFALAGWLLLA